MTTNTFSYDDAKNDILEYLWLQNENYFSERGTTEEQVLENEELIDRLAAEHLKCVMRFGVEREWSCKDACDNSPGIWPSKEDLQPFKIYITETLGREVEVYATNAMAAQEIAEELCNKGTIDLNTNDFQERNTQCRGIARLSDLQCHEVYDQSGMLKQRNGDIGSLEAKINSASFRTKNLGCTHDVKNKQGSLDRF